MHQTRLLLADDHQIFREGLRELIERKTNFTVVGEANTGREAIAQAMLLKPDMLLLDMQMPEVDGIAVARELAHHQPHIKIIMLTMFSHDYQMTEALRLGVRAYLPKDADAEELISVVQRVQRGDSVLRPMPTQRVFGTARDELRFVRRGADTA